MVASASRRRHGGSIAPLSSKHISLITLTLQNSALILIMHYSRVMPLVDGHRYFTSTAVFLNEVIKLAISLTMALYTIANDPRTPDTSTAAGLFGQLGKAVFTPDSWKLAIPALLYTLQNSLQYVAVSNLDAATFQVTYQLKILTTAIFSVVLLGRTFNARKWISLVLLMLGVAIVQIPTGPVQSPTLTVKDLRDGVAFHVARSIGELRMPGTGADSAAAQLHKRSATYEGIEQDVAAANPVMRPSVGIVALLGACVTSGLAGVYFEKVLKEPASEHRVSVWVRNVQLAFYSLPPALFIGVLWMDGEHIQKDGFFAGYNAVVWAAVLCQAVGGVLVALVVNYADNIAKNFATSISIVVSFLASVFFFDFRITPFYLIGTFTVLGATYLYSITHDHPRADIPPPISISDYEKDYEKQSAHRSGDSYFDLESLPTPARSPAVRNEALTTSRPGTPTFERLSLRAKSTDNVTRAMKREH